MNGSQAEITIFDFKNPLEFRRWVTMDDRVMGGQSKSHLGYSEKGNVYFRGNVRLNESKIGFASVRSKNNVFDLKTFDGVRVRVKGDGKTYRLNMKTEKHHDGFLYQHDFHSGEGEWIEHSIPFEAFLPFFRGKPAKDSPPLDPGNIKSFGLMVVGQEGEFELAIENIKAYGKSGTPPSTTPT